MTDSRRQRRMPKDGTRRATPEEEAAKTVRILSRISAALAAVTVGAVAFAIVFVGSAQGKIALLDANTTSVVTAIAPIEAGVVIQDSMLTVQDVPSYACVEGAIADPSSIVGRRAIGPIPTNAQVGESMLSGSQAPSSLADALEPQKVAVSLAVDAETGLSGLVKQGDTVDVLSESGCAAEGLKVLAVDSSLDESQPGYTTVTLQCDRAEAEALHAAQSAAPTRLALRSSVSEDPSSERSAQ